MEARSTDGQYHSALPHGHTASAEPLEIRFFLSSHRQDPAQGWGLLAEETPGSVKSWLDESRIHLGEFERVDARVV